MKTNLIMAAVLCCATTAFAQQKGDMAAGLNFNIGTAYQGGGYTNCGLGAKFQWNAINRLRIEPEFNYYFKKDFTSFWDLGVNAHYQFDVAEKMNVYPIFGLGVYGWKNSGNVLGVKWSDSGTNFGCRLGCGYEYRLNENISLDAEMKYAIVGHNSHNSNRLIISLGAAYHF